MQNQYKIKKILSFFYCTSQCGMYLIAALKIPPAEAVPFLVRQEKITSCTSKVSGKESFNSGSVLSPQKLH